MKTVTVHLQAADGSVQTLQARVGRSLMQEAVHAGVQAIAADCGGSLTCATCHVFVEAEWASRLPLPTADERSMLEMTATPCEPGSRLSCQITLAPTLDGLQVRLPASQY